MNSTRGIHITCTSCRVRVLHVYVKLRVQSSAQDNLSGGNQVYVIGFVYL